MGGQESKDKQKSKQQEQEEVKKSKERQIQEEEKQIQLKIKQDQEKIQKEQELQIQKEQELQIQKEQELQRQKEQQRLDKNNDNLLKSAILQQLLKQKKQINQVKNSQEIEQKQQEEKNGFNWGDSGQIDIKTIQFHIKYNQKKKGFDVLIPYNLIVTSQLEWKKVHGSKYSFKLFDKSVKDLENGDNKNCINKNQCEFEVTNLGELIGNEQQIKRFWLSAVENWIKNDIKQEKFEFQGIECSLVASANISQFNEIHFQLIEKLQNQSSFELMKNSPYLIKNQNDLWQESSTQVDKKFDQKSLRVLNLENTQFDTARIQLKDIKPQIICSNYTKKTIFQYQLDSYADIEMHLQLQIFCWPVLQGHLQEKFLTEEACKFQEYCDYNFQNMIKSLKEAVSIPLIYTK